MAARSCNDESPWNIRLLGAVGLFLDSVSFRELPWASGLSMYGVWRGNPKLQRWVPRRYSVYRRDWGIFSFREIP